MGIQTVFQRYEIKYMVSAKQKKAILKAMESHMKLDDYGRTAIRNIYYDTDNYRLVRRSIEKPVYKEKLRVRSYKQADENDKVFVELKKKYDSVVYKRRIAVPHKDAQRWLLSGEKMPGMPHKDAQIGREIESFLAFYQTLRPAVFLSYEREAYFATDGSDFRVTFDDNILARQERLSLGVGPYGESLLETGMSVMELKTSGGIPLWMTHALAAEGAFPCSFSKYGTAYQKMICEKERRALYA